MSSRTRYYNRYYPYRNGVARRARNQQRAADQQRDTTTVVVNTNLSFDCGQTMNEIYMNRGSEGWFDTGCMAINIYDVLRRSEYFKEFSNLYDQVKIDNIRAKIIATNWATAKEESNTERINEIIKSKSYIIVTAWDRSGISKDQIKFSDKWDESVDNKKFYVVIGKSIVSYSSAKTKHLGPGNAYEIVRQLYPESNYEKSQYISTSLLKAQSTRVNTEFFPYNCFYKKEVPVTNENPNGYVYEATDFDTKYPTNLISNPAVPFKPTLLVNVISGPTPYVTNIREKDPEGFYTVTTIGVNKIKPVTFDIEFDITVTFRGTRYNKTIIDNVPIKDLPVNPQFNSESYTNGEFRIENIEISDSRFGNKQIIDGPYSVGGTISRSALPDSSKNRYVVYLQFKSENNSIVANDLGIYVINYGSSRFSKTFTDKQIFLFDYIDDEYNEEKHSGGNYINVIFRRKRINSNDLTECYTNSKDNNVPPTNEVNPVGEKKFLIPSTNQWIYLWDPDEDPMQQEE